MKTLAPLLLTLSCATVGPVDRGGLTIRGTTPGSDLSVTPDACRLSGKRGVAFTSGSGPVAILIDDDGSGPRLQIGRTSDGKPALLEVPRAKCTTLAVQLGDTEIGADGATLRAVDAQIDCTLHGVNYAGKLHFDRCGPSASADLVLDSFRRTPAEAARVAALPRVPEHNDLPVLPPALRGLSFRVRARIAGALVGNETLAHAEQVCADGLTQMLSAAGWKPTGDSRPDLNIEGVCTGHAGLSMHGGLIEITYPVWPKDPGVIVLHDGEVVLTVPAGPLADFACETHGAAEPQAFTRCAAQAEEWARSMILGAVASSQPLLELAQRLSVSKQEKLLTPYPKSVTPSPAPVADSGSRADEAVALLDLGVALYEKGDLKGARAEFAAAEKLVPDKPNPWRWLGLADARLGRCADAVVELEKFLALAAAGDPRAVEVKELRDGCQRLRRK